MVWLKALMILFLPARVWRDLAEKPVSAGLLIVGLMLPLSLITSVIHLTGQELTEKTFLLSVIIYVTAVLISVSGGSYMLWRLAPRFLSQGTYTKVLNLTCYSYIAIFLAFIIASLHPQLEFVKFFGLYSLYLYWKGLSFMLKTPDDRKIGFTFISALVLTGTGYLVSIILNSLIFSEFV